MKAQSLFVQKKKPAINETLWEHVFFIFVEVANHAAELREKDFLLKCILYWAQESFQNRAWSRWSRGNMCFSAVMLQRKMKERNREK